MAFAWARTIVSVTPQWKWFQLFHPIGGVSASAFGFAFTMLTFSNVDIFRAASSCAVTASRTAAALAMVTWTVATRAQSDPSLDANATNVLPNRSSSSQYGAAGPITSAASTALAPATGRDCRPTPRSGVTNRNTNEQSGTSGA